MYDTLVAPSVKEERHKMLIEHGEVVGVLISPKEYERFKSLEYEVSLINETEKAKRE